MKPPEEVPEPTLNEKSPANHEAAVAYWKSEVARLQVQLGNMVDPDWKVRAIKAEAIVRSIPRCFKEVNSFTFFPRCPECNAKMKYFVAFRGQLQGKILGGNNQEEVEKRIEEQGQILFEKENLPDGLGPDDIKPKGE